MLKTSQNMLKNAETDRKPTTATHSSVDRIERDDRQGAVDHDRQPRRQGRSDVIRVAQGLATEDAREETGPNRQAQPSAQDHMPVRVPEDHRNAQQDEQ